MQQKNYGWLLLLLQYKTLHKNCYLGGEVAYFSQTTENERNFQMPGSFPISKEKTQMHISHNPSKLYLKYSVWENKHFFSSANIPE